MDDPHFGSDFKTHPWDSEGRAELAEPAQHIPQHGQPKNCPDCNGTGTPDSKHCHQPERCGGCEKEGVKQCFKSLI